MKKEAKIKSTVNDLDISVQGKTSEEIDREVYWTVCNRRGSIIECSKTVVTKFNENTSGSKCKLDSTVQEVSEGTKERRRKTGGS